MLKRCVNVIHVSYKVLSIANHIDYKILSTVPSAFFWGTDKHSRVSGKFQFPILKVLNGDRWKKPGLLWNQAWPPRGTQPRLMECGYSIISRNSKITRGGWAWWGYLLICSNVKAEKGDPLEKQNWLSNAIWRTNSVISGKKSLDSVLRGPSFYRDKQRAPLGPSVTTKRQGFPRYIVRTTSTLDSNCGCRQPSPASSGSGAFLPVTAWTHFTRLYSPPRSAVIETMLILLQSEQPITTAPALGPVTCSHFGTRFHTGNLHLWKAPSCCSEDSVIMIQESQGNPTAHLGTVWHRQSGASHGPDFSPVPYSFMMQKPLRIRQTPELLNHVVDWVFYKPKGRYGVLRVGESGVQILAQQD